MRRFSVRFSQVAEIFWWALAQGQSDSSEKTLKFFLRIQRDWIKCDLLSWKICSPLSNGIKFVKLKNSKILVLVWTQGGFLLKFSSHTSGNIHRAFIRIRLLILWALFLSCEMSSIKFLILLFHIYLRRKAWLERSDTFRNQRVINSPRFCWHPSLRWHQIWKKFSCNFLVL